MMKRCAVAAIVMAMIAGCSSGASVSKQSEAANGSASVPAAAATDTSAATLGSTLGSTVSSTGPTTPNSPTDLRGLCPDPIVIQTDWNPEAEHGGIYELVGPDYVVDADNKSVTGTLTFHGENTGVHLEVRAGGPAIGFQTPPVIMYQRPEIMLGFVGTDGAISSSVKAPVVAVFGSLEKSPLMIMWDPETYPDVNSIADLGGPQVPIRYFESEQYMAYLVQKGVVGPGQLDGSYNGDPKVFVQENGRIAQQGFASAEPYLYEHDLVAWHRPLKFQLIHDTGWQPYYQTLAARPEVIEALPKCFEKLVPMLQQAAVDYLDNPGRTNALILDLVPKYDTGWVYSAELAAYAVTTMGDLGLVGNGSDKTIGNFDEKRVQDFLDTALPVLDGPGSDLKPGLSASDLYTNRFIDPTIGTR